LMRDSACSATLEAVAGDATQAGGGSFSTDPSD
jgi:hypothetical protein